MLKKAKVEKAGIAEDLSDAEELSKCLHLSEDKKMSEIDELKGKRERALEENEERRRGA